jgi:lysozyme
MSWPADYDIFPLAKPLIKNAEGYSSKPYLCPAGVATIGWGSTRYPNGRKVTMTDSEIDQSWAEVCLTSAMRRVMEDLQKVMTRVPTTNQAAALVSLAYNVGVGARDDDGKIENLAESTLLAKFEAGDDMGAANEFPKWNKARVRGQLQPLAGLTKRRNMERELFLK